MAPEMTRRRMSRIAAAAAGIVLGGMAVLQPLQSAFAQGPVSVADLAENLADAVVNSYDLGTRALGGDSFVPRLVDALAQPPR